MFQKLLFFFILSDFKIWQTEVILIWGARYLLTVFVFFLLQRIKYVFEPERLLILKLFGGFDVHVVSGEVKRREFDLVPEMLVPDLEAG